MELQVSKKSFVVMTPWRNGGCYHRITKQELTNTHSLFPAGTTSS